MTLSWVSEDQESFPAPQIPPFMWDMKPLTPQGWKHQQQLGKGFSIRVPIAETFHIPDQPSSLSQEHWEFAEWLHTFYSWANAQPHFLPSVQRPFFGNTGPFLKILFPFLNFHRWLEQMGIASS